MALPSSRPAPALVRGLSLVAAIAVIIATVIGTGVFLKARVMTCNVGTPAGVLGVWAVAGVLSLAGALTYAELGAMMPKAGGEYHYLRAAYGPRWGFLNGWMQLLVNKGGTQAAVAVAFAIFLNDLVGGGIERPVLELGGFGVSSLQLVAVGVIAVATGLNLLSVRSSGGVATALTAVKVALVAGIGLGAFFLFDGSFATLGQSGAAGACEGDAAQIRGGLAGFSAAMLAALWGYDGWANLTLVAGEVKNPQRNIPRALVIGMLAIIGLYLLVNAAYFWVLSPVEVAGVSEASSVAQAAAARFLGPAFVGVMTAGLMLSSFGTLHGSMLTGARVPYALAQDGLLPARLGALSAQAVPATSVLFQGVWASLLALSGSFDQLTNYVVFGSWIFFALTISALFVLRRKMPDAERPYRAWGYPVVPALFLLVSGFLLVNTLLSQPAQSLLGLGLIALGLPVYAYYASRATTPTARHERGG